MIKPPENPAPAGKGKVADAIRNMDRRTRIAMAAGKGVSTGPLGTTIRTTRNTSTAKGGGAVWL